MVVVVLWIVVVVVVCGTVVEVVVVVVGGRVVVDEVVVVVSGRVVVVVVVVVDVAGEASILMNIQELSTAVQYRLPVKIFIINRKSILNCSRQFLNIHQYRSFTCNINN